jgi:virulence-associated protein VagC
MSSAKAKLFTIGGSQAVRIPKAMRLPEGTVSIRKVGRALLIEPEPVDEWAWLAELAPDVPGDPDFKIESRDNRMQERPELDKLFR